MSENAPDDGVRELHLVSFEDDEEYKTFDFRPVREVPEVEVTQDPKDSSALASAASSFPPDLIPSEQTETPSDPAKQVTPVTVEKDNTPPKVTAPSTQTSSGSQKTG